MPARRRAPVLLAACTLGLLWCPLGYVAIGAYQAFAPRVAVLTAPLLLASIGWLTYRLLARPTDVSIGKRAAARLIRRAAELVAVAFLGWFLLVFSDVRLMSVFERASATALFFLIASSLALPVVAWRGDSRLVQGWSRVHAPVALAVLGLWLGTAVGFAAFV